MAKVLWTQKQDIGPRPRAGHAMAFDSARSRVVLFGGDSLAAGYLADTWEWDGENWTQVADLGPAPRAQHAMAFDDARGRVILFGGETEAGSFGDTWEWDGESWTQVADTGPGQLSGHAMVYDAVRQRIVLFGGQAGDGALKDDTWEWDGNEWVQQEDVGPSNRRGHAMAYDPTRGRVVLFGGTAPAGAQGLGDTWEWDGTAWTQVADFGPARCVGAAMVFKGARVALFGGVGSLASSDPQPVFGLTWEWDGRHWTVRQDMGPGPRVEHAMAFDSVRGRVVLFGGLPVPPGDATAPSLVAGDTWEQFEASAATPGAGVTVVSLTVTPDIVVPPGTFMFTVTLSGPAPTGGVEVPLSVEGGEAFVSIMVPAGSTSGSVDVPITEEGIDPSSLPLELTVTAQLGDSGASTLIRIEAP